MRTKLHPYFVIVIAIPLLIVCWYLVQAVEALKVGLPGFVAANWIWLILAGLLLATPLWWRAYKAVMNHRDERRDRSTYRALLQAATVQASLGYNLEFTNRRTGDALKLTNPFPSTRVTVQEEIPLALPAPQAIPSVIRYSEIADQVPTNKTLLGIHPASGDLELSDWLKLKCLWVIGSSSTGKSNTVFGKALEAVRKGAKLLVVDQHATKEDSLSRKLASLQSAFLYPVAVSDQEVLEVLDWYNAEFERRVSGGPCSQKIVLICDEMNRMVRNDLLKKPLQNIVAVCGEESRGFGMFGWFVSQKAAHLKWLRDSAITVIAHRVTRFEEALLACNDDRKAAKRLLEFPVGRSYIYGVDFDEPVELQQPLYDDSLQDELETVSGQGGEFGDLETDGNTLETNGDAPSLRLLRNTDELETVSTKEKSGQVETNIVETIRRMKEVKPKLSDRDISKWVGLSGRKYGIYQNVLRELGYREAEEA